MTDVLLQQTSDGGEICFDADGNIQLTDDLRTSVYISLFGGGDWWADIAETNSNLKLTGSAGAFVKGAPASSKNLLLLEDEIRNDLAWMIEQGVASNIDVNVTLTNINKLTITVDLEYDGQQVNLIYSLNWTS